MTGLIIAFLVFLLSVWLGIQLSHDPGYVLITVNHWTIETSLVVAILIVAILFFITHSLLVLLKKLTSMPETYRQWRARKRIQSAQAKTRKGLIEFSEGYWASAKNNLIKALPDSDSPLLNYLTAARAAQEMGENQLRDDYLREAQQSVPDAKIAVELTQAQLQLAHKQWEQALATLRHLQDLAPHHPYVLKLLMRLYQEVRDWPQLIALLPDLKKYQVISDLDFDNLEHYAYEQSILDLVRLGQEEALHKAIRNLPKKLKNDGEIISIYCQFLMQNQQEKQAETLLKHCLRKQFDEQLVSLYGRCKVNDQQLPFAETLLKKHGNSAPLLLCLGRLSAASHLWGKAKSYLELSISIQPMSEAYAELGKLYEQLGDQNLASQAYRHGLELNITRATPLENFP